MVKLKRRNYESSQRKLEMLIANGLMEIISKCLFFLLSLFVLSYIIFFVIIYIMESDVMM